MKRKNPIPSEEARRINAVGDRPIDLLSGRELDRHLENIFLFKLGLRNSFGIDFRTHTYSPAAADGRSHAVLFNFLGEVLPLLKSRVQQLPPIRQQVYAKLADSAVASFWEIYYRFQPLIHRCAERSGVTVDDFCL